MKRTLIVLTCCALLVPAAAVQAQTEPAMTEPAQPAAANPLPEPDRDFVEAAAMSSSTEIDAGKLAQQNSEDKDVRTFARHMVRDHTKMSAKLKGAVPRGVTVPKDSADASQLATLRGLKGKEFDEAYIKNVGLKGHEDAIATFKKQIAEGQNAKLKQLAESALPTIEKHYEMAQSLAKKKGVSE